MVVFYIVTIFIRKAQTRSGRISAYRKEFEDRFQYYTHLSSEVKYLIDNCETKEIDVNQYQPMINAIISQINTRWYVLQNEYVHALGSGYEKCLIDVESKALEIQDILLGGTVQRNNLQNAYNKYCALLFDLARAKHLDEDLIQRDENF